MALQAGASHLARDVVWKRVRLRKLLWALAVVVLIAALGAGLLFERARQRAAALDVAARDYVEWIRGGDARASVELGAERRFAQALGVLDNAIERGAADDGVGRRVRSALASRLDAAELEPAAALRLDPSAWRCERATDCTRRDARGLSRALGDLNRALATRHKTLRLREAPLPLGGTPPPPLARPIPIQGSEQLASWLGTSAWGRLLRSRPPHVLDFPDGHHLALQARSGSVWAAAWTDQSPRRNVSRIAEVPAVECGDAQPLASDEPAPRCREVAVTAMVATRGGRVAVKLLRTDVSFVSELLLASADYGRTWQPGRARAVR